tara:strand:+ start:16761 stop:18533 length:1773 start_codon:yes stop_codon:yes gene_type:complete
VPERVIERLQISLNGIRYPITRPVQSALSSIYPPKIVIGDPDKDSGQGTSVVAWSDFRGGLGIYQMEGTQDVDRGWFLLGQRRKGHFVLPPLETATAAAAAAAVGVIGELSDEIYATYGTAVQKYDNGGNSWGGSLRTLAAAATDIITVKMLDGTDYLVIAQTSDYDYTSDGSSYSRSTKDAKYLAFWDDRLWGIDNTGQLWYSLVLGTEVDDAKLPLPDGYVTDLLVGVDVSGNPILYAATKTGLWAHDANNARFLQTGLQIPRNENAGIGCVNWRGDIYYPAGMAIYKYAVGGGGAVVSLIGPDRDHGVDSARRGNVKHLTATHNELICVVDNATTYSIMAWDGSGWVIMGSDSGNTFSYLYAGYAYSLYRLYAGLNQKVNYFPLNPDIVNFNEVSSLTYATAGTLVTPFFTAGQSEVDKLAIRLKVEVSGASANETVVVKYEIDFSGTLTTLGTISSNGVTTYQFPNATTPTGTTFRAIRFRCEMARGGTNTNTPDINSITLEFRKKLSARWSHTCEVAIKDYLGKTAKELRSNLLTATEGESLVEFTFRDDDGDTRNFYVDVASASGLEETGSDETGISRIAVVER